MYGKKIKAVLIITIAVIICMLQMNTIKYLPHKSDDTKTPEASETGLLFGNIEAKQDIYGGASVEPLTSGPVTELPWENDERFINEKNKNGVPVLMAAYRTVLRDPLPGEEYNVHLGADRLAGMIINPGKIFSQNNSIGPYTESKGYKRGPTYMGTQLITTIGGGVCKLASTLYNVAILSNMEIVERHNHSMPVPYVPYGQDATVSYGARDFRFRNNTSKPVMIWAKGIDNVLYIAFYGAEEPLKVEWHHKTLDLTKAPKIYQTNSELPAGTEKVIVEGMDGATVESWLTITNRDGTTYTKNLGISYYRPMAHVIEKGK